MKFTRKSIVTTFALLAVIVLASAFRLPSAVTSADRPCSLATLNGDYASRQTGTVNGLQFAQVNHVISDGRGNVTGTGTNVLDGVAVEVTFTATYTINSDCTGTFTSSSGVRQNLVITRDGSDVLFIVTSHPAGSATISGYAIKMGR